MFTYYISNQFTIVNGEKYKVTEDFIHSGKVRGSKTIQTRTDLGLYRAKTEAGSLFSCENIL